MTTLANKRRLPQTSQGNNTKLRKIIKSVLNNEAELKHFQNIHASATAASPLGFVHTITQPLIIGDDLQQRTGRQIRHRKTWLRFSVNLPTLGVSGVFRVIWVVDKQNTGVVPAVTDIINTASVTSPYTYNELANKRFKIIHDRAYSMVVGATNQHITPVIKFTNDYPIYYNGGTNVASANGVGSQFCLVITDLGLNPPLYSLEALTDFVDM